MRGVPVVGVALAGAVALTASSAVRFDWTDEEKACAASIGVDLGQPLEPGSAAQIRGLTWISDLVVFGRVVEITHDIEGDYPTILKIHVTLVKKGKPEAAPLYVMLMSGPTYYRPLGIMADVELHGEPSFQEGESVLLFLTKGIHRIPSDPTAFALGPGQYNLVNRTKFVVNEEIVRIDGRPGPEHPLDSVHRWIDLARTTQEGGCR